MYVFGVGQCAIVDWGLKSAVRLFAGDMVISNGFSDKDLSTPADDADDSAEGQWQEVGPKNRVTHITREVCNSLIRATSLSFFSPMFLISESYYLCWLSFSVCLLIGRPVCLPYSALISVSDQRSVWFAASLHLQSVVLWLC